MNKFGGYSMIELMVAASLGVMVVTAIQSIASKTLWTVEEIQASTEVLEGAQYLSGLLSRDIEMAGFYGDFYSSYTAISGPPNFCQLMNRGAVIQAMPYPIAGINDVASGYKLCGNEALLSGTDVILARSSSVVEQPPTYKLQAQQIYIQGVLDNFKVDHGDNLSDFSLHKGGKVAPVRAWQQTIYYVSKDNIFKRRRFLRGKYLRSEPLVDGVYDFQVEYAISSALDSSHCNTQENINYLSPPLTDTQWEQVVAVRFHLLLRSSWQGVDQIGKRFHYAGKYHDIEESGYYALFSGLTAIMNKIPKRVVFDLEI